MTRSPNRSGFEYVTLPLLAAFGAALTLFYGRMGFMPLDHSIVFDGAWRLLSGQFPYRDFVTPNGIVPIAIQALFFRLFGVNWFAYCLHAAVFNALFCLLAYALLRLLDAPRWLALFGGILSGVVFYPPLGTPYLEQHSFFFILVAAVLAITASRRAKGILWLALWLLVPIALVLGLLSKQIPAVLGFPLVLGIALVMDKGRRLRAAALLVAGTALAAVLVWLAGRSSGVDFEQVRIYALDLPSALGRERLDKMLHDPAVLSEALFWPFRHRIKIWHGRVYYTNYSAYIMVLFAFGYLYAALQQRRSRPWNGVRTRARAMLPEVGLAAGLAAICWLTAAFTDNLQENNIPFVYIALAIFYLAATRVIFGTRSLPPGQLSERRLLATRSASLGLIVFALFDAYMFNNQVNADRVVHDFVYDARRFKAHQQELPQMLLFMRWGTPGAYAFQPGEVKAVTDYIRAREGGLFVLGDASIFYALTGRQSTNPSLWFHYGLTIPRPGTGLFDSYEQRLLDNFRRFDVRFVLLEGELTWLRARLSDFDRLTAYIAETPHTDTSFGFCRLIELAPGAETGLLDADSLDRTDLPD
jgi:hypothetical protein